MRFDTPLPIDGVLPRLQAALAERASAVLVAAPGAGKTTRVPLALLDAPWLAGKRLLVLEPRRLAARGAAERMARTLSEQLGDAVGIRSRLMTRVSERTRIEVVTEGVFTRMILDDPSLDGIGAVLLDEFHERSLDADLALALSLDAQSALRPDLRLLVMSATLEAARVSRLLGDAPVIESEGRQFPVETHYLGRDPARRIEDRMTDAIAKALGAEPGSILAFLPGQGEIRRVAERLADRIRDPDVVLAPLYGALTPAEQQAAIEPAPAGRRKIVLATAIAETSLTIEGVRVVVDCGLSRVPRFEPGVGMTRLETVRVSRASADQRRGRAGRTQPGVCYRLWDEPETLSLSAFTEPEILTADLAGLVLDCAAWGTTDPRTLSWLDPPPAAALDAAREELAALDAIDAAGRLTDTGRTLRELPLPPRLARMVIAAAHLGAARDAADIAAVLVERGLGGNESTLSHRLESFRRDRGRRAEDMRRLAVGWARSAGALAGSASKAAARPSVAETLALAYPDRLAKARGARGHFILSSGRGARVDESDALAKAPALVAAELQGSAAAARILLAEPIGEDELRAIAGGRITIADEVGWDEAAAAVRARRIERLDAIVLSSQVLPVRTDEATASALARGLAARGIARLPWSKAQAQLRDRIAFLRDAEGETTSLPDLSDDTLAATVDAWLAPFLVGKTKASDVTAEELGAALDALVPYAVRRRLDDEVPTHFEAPTGQRHPIDYDGDGAPALHIRVQELFGLKTHPSVAGGRRPLTLHLLSPAHRPIQITRDLPGFWSGSWAAVKADMKGRYPKHPWPDDPADAAPTTRAKPRGT